MSKKKLVENDNSQKRELKEYRGSVIREFSLNGINYIYGDIFKTSNKEQYNNLINIKRIKLWQH